MKYFSHKHYQYYNDYYIIYRPTAKNAHTLNACVKYADIKKYDKNFIYQYRDGAYKTHTIMIGRKQVADNVFPIFKYEKDENNNVISKKFICYGIKLSIIFTYGKEI